MDNKVIVKSEEELKKLLSIKAEALIFEEVTQKKTR